MKKFLSAVLFVFGLSLVSGLIYSVFKPHTATVQVISAPSAVVIPECNLTDSEVLNEVNKRRLENGLNPLILNDKLEEMAEFRVKQEDGRLDEHAGAKPYIDSHYFGDFFVSNNEVQNISLTCDAKSRIDQFKASAPHWRALTTARYDSLGIGFYKRILIIELGDLR